MQYTSSWKMVFYPVWLAVMMITIILLGLLLAAQAQGLQGPAPALSPEQCAQMMPALEAYPSTAIGKSVLQDPTQRMRLDGLKKIVARNCVAGSEISVLDLQTMGRALSAIAVEGSATCVLLRWLEPRAVCMK